MEQQEAIQVAITFAGWTVAGIGALIAWAVKEGLLRRLDAFEVRQEANGQRLASLEKLVTATVTHIELAKSVDGLRQEIAATRHEIKSDVQQIVTLLMKE